MNIMEINPIQIYLNSDDDSDTEEVPVTILSRKKIYSESQSGDPKTDTSSGSSSADSLNSKTLLDNHHQIFKNNGEWCLYPKNVRENYTQRQSDVPSTFLPIQTAGDTNLVDKSSGEFKQKMYETQEMGGNVPVQEDTYLSDCTQCTQFVPVNQNSCVTTGANSDCNFQEPMHFVGRNNGVPVESGDWVPVNTEAAVISSDESISYENGMVMETFMNPILPQYPVANQQMLNGFLQPPQCIQSTAPYVCHIQQLVPPQHQREAQQFITNQSFPNNYMPEISGNTNSQQFVMTEEVSVNNVPVQAQNSEFHINGVPVHAQNIQFSNTAYFDNNNSYVKNESVIITPVSCQQFTPVSVHNTTMNFSAPSVNMNTDPRTINNDQNCYVNSTALEADPNPHIYPSVHISERGIISVLLSPDLTVQMTIDRTVRIVNYSSCTAVAMNILGDISSIYHNIVKIHHESMNVEIDIPHQKRKIKLGHSGIEFADGNFLFPDGKTACLYLHPRGCLYDTPYDFRELSEDSSEALIELEALTEDEVQHMYPQLDQIVQHASYNFQDDGGVSVMINGVSIQHRANSDVFVQHGVKRMHLSCANNTAHVDTEFCEMAIEANCVIKVHATGANGMKAIILGNGANHFGNSCGPNNRMMVMSDGKWDCGINEMGSLFVAPTRYEKKTIIFDGMSTENGINNLNQSNNAYNNHVNGFTSPYCQEENEQQTQYGRIRMLPPLPWIQPPLPQAPQPQSKKKQFIRKRGRAHIYPPPQRQKSPGENVTFLARDAK